MEPSKCNFGMVIFNNSKRGLSTQGCSNEIENIFGTECPTLKSIQNRHCDFHFDRQSLDDEVRDGRPATAVTPDNVEIVRQLIEDDQRIIYVEIKQVLGISSGKVFKILHEHLGIGKICARWVPTC